MTARLVAALPLLTLALAPLAPAQDGVCDPVEQIRGRCFVTPDGYVVEAVTGPLGEFPVVDANGDSVFAYSVTGPGVGGASCQGVRDISHVSFLLPVCDPATGAGPDVIGASPAVGIQNPGHGDPSCGFGAGDASSRVVKWDFGSGCSETSIYSVTVAGLVPAAPTRLSLKAGTACFDGVILGPSCDGPFEPFCIPADCPCSSPSTNGGGCVNSTGNGGVLSHAGSNSVAADDFVLVASNLPPNQFALFIMARSYEPVAMDLGSGVLCVGGLQNKIIRIRPVAMTDAAGTASTAPGLVALSCSGQLADPALSCISPGSSFDFQLYYRDPAFVGPCGEPSNLTNGLRVTFTN